MDKLTKYIVEINTNGKARDIEIYARNSAEAVNLVQMREGGLQLWAIRVRGEA